MVGTGAADLTTVWWNYGPHWRSGVCRNCRTMQCKSSVFGWVEIAGHPATTVQVRYKVLVQYRKVGRCFDLACCLYPTAAFVRPKDLSDGHAALVAGTLMCLCRSLSLIAPSGNHCGKTGTVRSVRIFPKMLIFARKTLKKPIMMPDNGIGSRCLNLIETVTWWV